MTEPIRNLFGGDVSAFLAAGDAFFHGVGKLLHEQFARSTALEQAILCWLAIERELVPLSALLSDLGDGAPQREVFVALESLRHRMLIERGPGNPTFTLQPVILEYITDHLVEAIAQEVTEGQPRLLCSHAIVQATAKDYVRRSQEQMIAMPLLERLGKPDAADRQLLAVLASLREQPRAEQGYGPGNVVNLLRLLRGHLRELDLAGLALRQVYLQGIEAHDTSLAGSFVRDSIFTEAFGSIQAVAVSPDGMHWAAGSINGSIRVWRDDGRTMHLAIQGHAKEVTTLAFSPDGQILASGSYDCTIKLWSVATGAPAGALEGHTDYVQSIAFAPDGRMLVSASDDWAIRLWDVGTGACLQIWDDHTDNVYGVVWSPDGRFVASCSFDRTLRVWDVASGACVRILAGHTRRVSKLACSPDGRLLASGGFDAAVKLWDLASGQCLHTFAGHTSEVKAIAWSPDGQTIASASSDTTIRLWDVNHDMAQRVLQGRPASINAIAFTAGGSRLISGNDDQTVRVWDVASGWCVRVIQGYNLYFHAVAWSPDGRRLLSANSNTTLTVWNVADGTAAQTLYGHSHTVYAAAWSPDGAWLASGGFDQTIRLWDAATGACVRVIPAHDDSIYRVTWSPDGRWLASASRDQTVRVWNTDTGECRWVGRAHTDTINEVTWHPDGRRLASCSEDRTLRIWRAEDGALLQTLSGHTRSVAGIAWSPDGRTFASCGGGGTTGEIFLWDAESGAQVGSFSGHASLVFRVAWSMDGTMLFSGGVTGNIRWWDVESRACLHTLQGHQGWIRTLSPRPDGTMLVSAGDDSSIHLWDIARAEPIRTLRATRPYESLDIAGVTGLTEAQKASLVALGARDRTDDRQPVRGGSADRVIAAPMHPAAPNAQNAPLNAAISLPFQATSFVGRRAELVTIDRLLADPACRLLTLLGPGGIGKTRLALAVAAEQAGAFADGVAFVALASVNTPDQIVFAIGDALMLSFAGQPDPVAHLLGHLRARHMLLVLDNFEHLLDGADLVSAILTQAPHVIVLMTSRERLNLQAEWLFDVKGLAYPPTDPQTPAAPQHAAADYSAVQLFVQRATQAQPELALSDTMVTTIVRICQQIAGMPLAIELAAASLRTLPLAEIERQIRANMDVLATTLRDVPARHRSMRAVFDHSWQLLSKEERALFSHLAVFYGGWTAEAAIQVASATRAALTTLVDKSLVCRASAAPRSSAAHTEPDTVEEPRFLMLEPIREYALERLATRADAETMRQRHAHYYTALAETAAAEWNTPLIEVAITQLRREYDNMRAALRWASSSGHAILGLSLAQALWKFWRSYSYTSEGRAWLERLLALDEPSANPTLMAARQRALQAAAWLASDQHDFEIATRLFEQSMALRRALGQTEGETDLQINAARQARVAGQYRRATALLEDVVAQYRAIAGRTAIGSAEPGFSFDEFGLALRELGLLRREQGDFERAAALFAEGLALHRALRDRASEAFVLLGLADVARDQGDAAGVRTYGEPSLAILRELGIEWAIGFALHTLALGASYEGDLTRALELIQESIGLFRGLRATGSLAEVLITLGKIALARRDAAAAAAALAEALQCAWAVGPRLMVALALEGVARVMVAQGHAEVAARCVAAAAALRAQMGTPVWPVDQMAVEQTLASARSMLGVAAYASIWDAAQGLPLEQILRTIPNTRATAKSEPEEPAIDGSGK